MRNDPFVHLRAFATFENVNALELWGARTCITLTPLPVWHPSARPVYDLSPVVNMNLDFDRANDNESNKQEDVA